MTRCDECGEEAGRLPVPGRINLCEECEDREQGRIEVLHGALLPSLDIFGEPCFEAYDDGCRHIGCFRTRAAAEQAILRRWHRWDLKGLAL